MKVTCCNFKFSSFSYSENNELLTEPQQVNSTKESQLLYCGEKSEELPKLQPNNAAGN
jgi:hypothetical protein